MLIFQKLEWCRGNGQFQLSWNGKSLVPTQRNTQRPSPNRGDPWSLALEPSIPDPPTVLADSGDLVVGMQNPAGSSPLLAHVLSRFLKTRQGRLGWWRDSVLECSNEL